MTASFNVEVNERVTECDCGRPAARAQDKKGMGLVYMMELWSFVPYYMACLSKSLRDTSVKVVLGSVRYHLDREYFRKVGLKPDPRLLDFGGSIHSNILRRLVKSIEYVANLFVLGLRFSLSQPDILHVQYLPFLEHGFTFELWFLKWVKYLGIRVVYTVHNVTPQNTADRHKSIYRHAYRMADSLICHSEGASSELIRDFEVAAEKIWVIPHGPLFDEKPQISPQEARAKLRLPVDKNLALCFGVISEYKGIPFLLDAWKRVIGTGVKGRLLIAGTGDPRLMSTIREKVLADGIDSSVDLWLRFISVDEVSILHQAADILVYPYKAGTTSGALLTGLNYGKAVVATRLPFFLEHLVDSLNARLVDYGDVDALGQVLLQLLHDPQEREKLGQGVVNQARKTESWDTIARSTIDCYRAAIHRTSRHG